VLSALRRRQTLASFDYQWGALPAGDAMLSDPWFLENVDAILAEQLLGIDRRWFEGRTALDAGCGGGRWTAGLLRLGARVTAVDFSRNAVEATRAQAARVAPAALAEGRLVAHRADLLEEADLPAGPFDLVFSFGVLHHTGHTRRALENLSRLVADDGVLFVYLYGARSVDWRRRLALLAGRTLLAPLPFEAKKSVLRRLLPGRDVHQSFDLFSPVINDRYDHGQVEAWLRELGFSDIARTLEHSELFLRAARARCSARPFLPPATPPYWFERYRHG
jgi:SAM-dependent methyltransferase